MGVGGAVGALARRPDLWGEAIGAGWSLRPRRWWSRPPFLPFPDRRLLVWRLHTAYGFEVKGTGSPPEGEAKGSLNGSDLIAFLQWRRLQRVAS